MADSGNKQNAHAPPSGNPVPHLCVLVCVPYLRPPNTVVHLPLTPFDLFFPLLFLILPLFRFSCAIHLRACKIRDAPTSLAFWGDEGGWLCSNSLRSTSSHHHPNESQRFTTPAPTQPTISPHPMSPALANPLSYHPPMPGVFGGVWGAGIKNKFKKFLYLFC